MLNVTCIEQLQTKHLTFKPGETYSATQINEHWWLVDSVGVSVENFKLYFEVVE